MNLFGPSTTVTGPCRGACNAKVPSALVAVSPLAWAASNSAGPPRRATSGWRDGRRCPLVLQPPVVHSQHNDASDMANAES